ncbi:hypothetical protein [Clavibacter michiganensis]|uniref:hypothetical protein n=1 Tax=Clavibacter michiganensis TaxID=28447 RepID=UPI000CE785C3|nr:hypothetical protein [Clavibacter michiganensis]
MTSGPGRPRHRTSTPVLVLVWVLACGIVVGFAVIVARDSGRELAAVLSGPLVILSAGLGTTIATNGRREPPP